MSDKIDDPEKGIAYARAGVAAGALISIAGNVANVVLTPGWRGVSIPGAVVWPSFLWIAIEIMVRNRHRRGFTGYGARVALMSVSVTTFVTSFVNLNGFMTKTHEPWIATITGPLGIDGLMLGSTLMLLAATMSAQALTNAHEVVSADAHETVSALMSGERKQYFATEADTYTNAQMMEWAGAGDGKSTLTDEDIWAGVSERLGERPVSAPPVSVPVVSGEVRERRPRERAVSTAQIAAIEMLMSGDVVSVIVHNTGISRPTVQRMKNAVSALMNNPQADVSAFKLTGEVVSFIRAKVSQP